MGLRSAEDSSESMERLLRMGYTMLFGTPVLPLVGVMEQTLGIDSTTSPDDGGATWLGGLRESAREKVETARTPDTGGGSKDPKRTRLTSERSRMMWSTSGVHFVERKVTVRPESQIA